VNDDAKFFFFLSGFIGFVFFYACSLFLYRDLVMSLVFGAIGSVVFSFFGRILLTSALRKVQNSQALISPNSSASHEIVAGKSKASGEGNDSDSVLDSSVKANLAAVANDSKSLKQPNIKK
jgi:hypothetical protein